MQQRDRDQADLGLRAGVAAARRSRRTAAAARPARTVRVAAIVSRLIAPRGFLAQHLLADAEQVGGLARQQIELERIRDQLQNLGDRSAARARPLSESARRAPPVR